MATTMLSNDTPRADLSVSFFSGFQRNSFIFVFYGDVCLLSPPRTCQMESDSLENLLFAFRQRSTGGDAAWQIRNIGRKICSGILNHNGIAHGGLAYHYETWITEFLPCIFTNGSLCSKLRLANSTFGYNRCRSIMIEPHSGKSVRMEKTRLRISDMIATCPARGAIRRNSASCCQSACLVETARATLWMPQRLRNDSVNENS